MVSFPVKNVVPLVRIDRWQGSKSSKIVILSDKKGKVMQINLILGTKFHDKITQQIRNLLFSQYGIRNLLWQTLGHSNWKQIFIFQPLQEVNCVLDIKTLDFYVQLLANLSQH